MSSRVPSFSTRRASGSSKTAPGSICCLPSCQSLTLPSSCRSNGGPTNKKARLDAHLNLCGCAHDLLEPVKKVAMALWVQQQNDPNADVENAIVLDEDTKTIMLEEEKGHWKHLTISNAFLEVRRPTIGTPYSTTSRPISNHGVR